MSKTTANFPIEEQKAKAIELLKQLDIYEPYIDDFKEKDQVCFFERYGGYWVFQKPELKAKMREIEKRYKCKVYAITHEYTEFGELYSFLIVDNYPQDWDTLIESYGNKHNVFAYVWNKDDEWCSELGTITVQSIYGGIKRIG